MQLLHAIVATNAVITLDNGQREVIADEAIEDMARQVNEEGGRPQLINHDWLKPCGWARRAWTEREGDLLRLKIETVIPENENDWQMILQKYRDYVHAWRAKRTAPFEDLVKTQKRLDVSLECDTDCVYIQAPGLAKSVCPTVFAKMDDDGLTPLKDLEIGEDGWLHSDGFLLVPSRLLRQGFNLPNPLNRRFLASFLKLAKQTSGCDPTLLLDTDLLGIPQSLKPAMERDYWWGPPYRGCPSSQPYGVTVHGPTHYDSLSGLIRTEFWWYGKTERTFEIEELVERIDLKSNRSASRGMRFVHSIFNNGTDIARHLDGAVRTYSKEKWQIRTDPNTNIAKFGKQAERTKVWRVDGNLSTGTWYELIHMFFHGNFSVAEYFRLPDPKEYQTTQQRS